MGVPQGGKQCPSWGVAGLPLWEGIWGHQAPHFTGDEFYPSGCCLFLLGRYKYFVPSSLPRPTSGESGSSHRAPNSRQSRGGRGTSFPQQDLHAQVRASPPWLRCLIIDPALIPAAGRRARAQLRLLLPRSPCPATACSSWRCCCSCSLPCASKVSAASRGQGR